ncbi:ribosomal-protein-alanine acetyltransferase [Marinomonas sp. MED121]|uniref:GNAT family N-acetyltransferase n=1 Tax=Marinomonas sp. MED121 TaxID=314277 RepID=UPI0000690F6C|nr:GNAT family N-acetyltransferase [Marinomonas sp. MED121]EAQ67618.1 ribosomal-protein-alanine acetyltransferase [Marinomonas sp. MED121]
MLTTERLVLSQPSIADFALFSEILACPKQTRFLPSGSPLSLIQREKYLHKRLQHWHDHGFGTFVIGLKDENYDELKSQCSKEEGSNLDELAYALTPIGFVGIEYTPKGGELDIRFALIKEYEGLGYTAEASALALDFMSKNTSHKKVYGVAVTENHASKKVLHKLGMRPVSAVSLYDSSGLDYFVLEL